LNPTNAAHYGKLRKVKLEVRGHPDYVARGARGRGTFQKS